MANGPTYRGQFGSPAPGQFKMSNGPQYRGQFVPTGSGSRTNISVGTSPPPSPAVGDLWVDTN